MSFLGNTGSFSSLLYFTHAEPNKVPKNGNKSPIAMVSIVTIYHTSIQNACFKPLIGIRFCLLDSCGIIDIDERKELV